MGASLVSKCGSITCSHLESPKLAFAWEKVVVSGPCLGGTVIGGSILVEGRVTSAQLRSCGQIETRSIENSSRGDSVVLLVNKLVCTDYTRKLDRAQEGKYRKVNRLKDEIALAEEADMFTHHQIHSAYRTGLFYLLGGVDSATAAVDLHGKQLKSLYMGQIVAFGESVAGFYKQVYAFPDEFDSDRLDEFRKSTLDAFKFVKKEIDRLPEAFGSTHRRYLIDRSRQFVSLERRLHRDYDTEHDKTFLELSFSKVVGTWRTDLNDNDCDVRELILTFGLEKKLLERIEHEPESLEELLSATVREKGSSFDLNEVQRASSPLIKLLKTSVDRSKRSIEENNSKVERCRMELREIYRELEEHYLVKYADSIPGSCSVESDRYASGVIITASALSRRGRDTAMAKVIVLDKAIDKRTVFYLKDRMIQRRA